MLLKSSFDFKVKKLYQFPTPTQQNLTSSNSNAAKFTTSNSKAAKFTNFNSKTNPNIVNALFEKLKKSCLPKIHSSFFTKNTNFPFSPIKKVLHISPRFTRAISHFISTYISTNRFKFSVFLSSKWLLGTNICTIRKQLMVFEPHGTSYRTLELTRKS